VNRDVLDKVRTISIVEVIGAHVTLKKSGARFIGNCPFHAERTPSFQVTERAGNQGLFHCFGCKAGGDVITFVQKMNGYTFQEAVESLAKSHGIETTVDSALSRKQAAIDAKRRNISEIVKILNDHHVASFRGSASEEYMLGRGITLEACLKHEIGHVDPGTDWLRRELGKAWKSSLAMAGLYRGGGLEYAMRGRSTMPIQSALGAYVSLAGRLVAALPEDQKAPKYLTGSTTEAFDKSETVFGMAWSQGDIVSSQSAIVVEGFLDVIGLRASGVMNVVASMGTALRPGQARIIARRTKLAYIAYDSDEAGKGGVAKAAAELMSAGVDARYVDVAPHKDPMDCVVAGGAEDFIARMASSVDCIVFAAERAKQSVTGKGPVAIADAAAEVAATFSVVSDDSVRQSVMGIVAQHLGVDRAGLVKRVDSAPKGRGPLPQSKASVAEMCMLAILLESSEARRATRNDSFLFEALQGAVLSQSFGAVLSMEDPNDIAAAFSDQGSAGQNLIEAVALKESFCPDVTYEACRREIMVGWRRLRLATLQEELRKAETEGLDQEAMALLEKKNRLIEYKP
jgi:DNA primase